MRTSRKSLIAGVLLLALQACALLQFGRDSVGPLLSDLAQLGLGILAVITSFQAARRSGTFGRIFWKLAGAAFLIWSVGQVLGTYYGSILNFPTQRLWGVDVFYHVWVAPLVMCLFLDPEAEAGGVDWQRILDFAQVVIVIFLVYLYFSHLSMQSDVEAWRLALATDAVITTGFFARAGFARRHPAAWLFRQFGYFRLLAFATDLYIVFGPPNIINAAWFDVVWGVPWLVPLLTASRWRETSQQSPVLPSALPARRLLITQLFPLIFPVLVLIMASQVARMQLALAAVAVLLSLGLSYARLLITSQAGERSERRFRAVFEGSPVGIAVIDMQGKAYEINPAYRRMLGLSLGEPVTNEVFNELTYPEHREADRARYLELITGKREQDRREKRYLRRDGRSVWADLNLTMLRDSSGAPQYVMVMAIDITERKRLEEQLLQAQKMEAIGTLSGGIAHDFNNLLTVIKGYSQLAVQRLQHEPELRSQIERVEQAAEQAASLTRQLLAFSRRQVLQPRVFDLNVLVTNLDKMLRRLIGEHIEMQTKTATDLGAVKADPSQIEQVILNLAVNARDAMPAGGKLSMETGNVHLDELYALEHLGARPGQYVMLRVSDTGVGIEPAMQARIFEPFFTTKDPGKGTGLGLAMVYGIVKQSGGYIAVESEPGRGSTFKIYLPQVDEPAAAVTPESSRGAAAKGSETILLVEDDPRVRELARTVLRSCGYSVLTSENPLTAASLGENYAGPIHLLLTDVVMPGMSGRDLANQLLARRPAMRILYMSGYASEAMPRVVLDPDTFFLPKPFSPTALTAKVREVLDQPKTVTS